VDGPYLADGSIKAGGDRDTTIGETMKLKDYQYITHKIIFRPWGVECRFTVARLDGTHINDIVMLKDGKEDETQLALLIFERLKKVDIPSEIIISEMIYTETEAENLMIEKGYLVLGQDLSDLKSKENLLEIKAL